MIFLARERKEVVDLDGWGLGETLEGEIMITNYCIKHLLSIRKSK